MDDIRHNGSSGGAYENPGGPQPTARSTVTKITTFIRTSTLVTQCKSVESILYFPVTRSVLLLESIQ